MAIDKSWEVLERAIPLYAVADGRKTRLLIDAVRDAMLDALNNYGAWSEAMEALTIASESQELFGGFQAWEHQDGRTIEECRKALRRSVKIAKRLNDEAQERRYQ